MKTFLSNLKHAARNNETVIIGGGEFSPTELREIIRTIEKMALALDHYGHGGTEYRKPAHEALIAYKAD